MYTDPSGARATGGLKTENELRALMPERYLRLSVEPLDRKVCLPKAGCINNGDVRSLLSPLFGGTDYQIASTARSWALSQSGIDGGSGPGNARQHLFFSIGMTIATAINDHHRTGDLAAAARKSQAKAIRLLDRHENIYNGSVKGPMDAARMMDLTNNALGVSMAPGIVGEWQMSSPRWLACYAYELQGMNPAGICSTKAFTKLATGFVNREIEPGGRAVWAQAK
jgi:hypothetical protein